MPDDDQVPRVVSSSREVAAGAGTIFELIAVPAWQPRWDGNDNLATASGGQRVQTVDEVFTVTLTHDGAAARGKLQASLDRLATLAEGQ
jgi:hypothetical protein